MILQFTVDGMPETKGSMRYAGYNPRTGKPRLVSDNDGEAAWAEAVAWAARQALRRPPTPDRERYRVALDFTLLPPPNGRRTNRRDADKLARSVLDALTGIVWLDDEQVDDLHPRKFVVGQPGARASAGLIAEIEPLRRL